MTQLIAAVNRYILGMKPSSELTVEIVSVLESEQLLEVSHGERVYRKIFTSQGRIIA